MANYSADELRRFRDCHKLLLDAEAALQKGFSLAFDPASEGVARDFSSQGATQRPFESPMFWAPYVVVGVA